MITLIIRYTIDARKRSDFEQYARALGGTGVRRAEESGCILVEDRAFLERV